MDEIDKEILEQLFSIENKISKISQVPSFQKEELKRLLQVVINRDNYMIEAKLEAIRILSILENNQNN